MSDFATMMREEARLIILRSLDEEIDGRLSSELLRLKLNIFGINKSREWLHEEMKWLADVGAIRIEKVETVYIGQLLKKGSDHISRAYSIDGVKRPSYQGD